MAFAGERITDYMIRTLSRLDPHSAVGTLLRMPLRLIPRSSVLTVRSGLNKGARWRIGSSIQKCWLGTYEPEKQDLLSRLVRPGMVVWDVGANAGFYTLALSRLVGSEGRVYAFEPFAENVGNILKHVELNDLHNVVIVQAALGERDGLIGFEAGRLNAMGHVSQDGGSYLVPTFTVDEFVAQHPEARPDLFKIDVEGAESGLLRGATQFLSNAAPDIVLALHGETQSRQCFEQLMELGYTLYRLDGSPMPSPPGERDEIYAVKGADSTGASANRRATPQ